MKDMKKGNRFLDVYFELCLGKRFSIDDIQDVYNVSRRTAQRILEDIDMSVCRLEYEIISKKKYWFLSEQHRKLLLFTNDDLLNLYKVKNTLPNTAKDEADFLDKFLAKVKATPTNNLSDNDIYTLLKVEGKAVSQYPQENINNEILKTIRQCILAMQRLRIKYKKSKEVVNRVVYPYGILKSTKSYLIATDERNPYRYKYYALSKIKSAVNTNTYFDMNENFDIEKFKNESFGVWQGEIMDVCLKFTGKAVEDVLNYNFHPTQEIEQQKDGSALVKFQASGDKAICWEIFKWEPFVEIIAPQKLKEDYIAIANKVIKKYS